MASKMHKTSSHIIVFVLKIYSGYLFGPGWQLIHTIHLAQPRDSEYDAHST